MMLVLALGRFGDPKSRVLTHIRRHGATSREELVRLTGLSSSSVARTVTALLDGGLVRERPDLIPDTAIGRPSYPVELDTGNHVTLGCHVGRRTTTVSLGDISGRVVARRSFRLPRLVRDLRRTRSRSSSARSRARSPACSPGIRPGR